MALVKRSTPKSRSIQSLDRIRKNLAVHVSLSVFSFQTAWRHQRQQCDRSLGNRANSLNEARQGRRSAAAPSRWPVYRRHNPTLSTRFLKKFRDASRLRVPKRMESGFRTLIGLPNRPIWALRVPFALNFKNRRIVGGSALSLHSRRPSTDL